MKRVHNKVGSRLNVISHDHNVNDDNGDEQRRLREGVSLERHYSVNEVSKLWGLSVKTIRRLFRQEPGVIEFGSGGSRFKRVYVTRRIPESVLERVHRRLRRAGLNSQTSHNA